VRWAVARESVAHHAQLQSQLTAIDAIRRHKVADDGIGQHGFERQFTASCYFQTPGECLTE